MVLNLPWSENGHPSTDSEKEMLSSCYSRSGATMTRVARLHLLTPKSTILYRLTPNQPVRTTTSP